MGNQEASIVIVEADPPIAIEITCRDLHTGDTDVKMIHGDDYCVIVSGRSYIAHTNVHKNGTHQITIKVADS